MSEQAIVVGASGFIGRNVTDALVAKGVEVIAVTSRGGDVPGAKRTLPLIALAEAQSVSKDAVLFHLAARRYDARTFAAEQSAILADNVAITDAVYGACVKLGITEVRQASSCAVHPARETLMRDDRPLDLNAAPHAGESFYAWSKRWGEIAATLHADRFGISTLSFRLTNPFGPYDSTDPGAAHVAAAFVMRALEPGEVFALRGAHVERDFLYAGDVADVFVKSLTLRGQTDALNLGRGENTTLAELAETVVVVAGGTKRIEREEGATTGPAQRSADASRVKAMFGIEQWTSLRDGLAKTVEWYREHA